MAMFIVIRALIVLQCLTIIEATTVEVTVPVVPIKVGDILPLQCQIENMKDNYKVKIQRVINGRPEEITSDLTYQSSSVSHRVFLTKRPLPGKTYVYFMTIVDITKLDTGSYSCKVYDFSTGEYVKVAEDSINVDVYSLPDPVYPQCQNTPADMNNVDENTEIRLMCLSSKGVPTVNLQWKTYENVHFVSREKEQDDTVSTEISFRMTNIYDGVVFICEMTNTGFQDFVRTCQVGPVNMRRDDRRKGEEIVPPVMTKRPIKQNTANAISHTCDMDCRSEDRFLILYLSVATIGAGMLSVVFLTTTIVWCCKYSKVSAEARNQRNITSGDGSEPVYVSLQRQPEKNRDSMFMSLDDPNNPGNKVMVPKEVFDEFSRSLSLKRGPKDDVHV